MNIESYLYDELKLSRNPHKIHKNPIPIGESQYWSNVEDWSCFLYLKGAHSILANIIKLGKDHVSYKGNTQYPINQTLFIPIVDPLYAFFGGYFSCTKIHLLNNSEQDQEQYLWKLFDDLTKKILDGEFISNPHLISLPTRLLNAFEDNMFDIDNVNVIDLDRHGINTFIFENFSHLPDAVQLRMYKSAESVGLTAYNNLLSTAFIKYRRYHHDNSLINAFENEYKLFDALKRKARIDKENKYGKVH